MNGFAANGAALCDLPSYNETSHYETLSDKGSAYDVPVEDMAEYDDTVEDRERYVNPITSGDIRHVNDIPVDGTAHYLSPISSDDVLYTNDNPVKDTEDYVSPTTSDNVFYANDNPIKDTEDYVSPVTSDDVHYVNDIQSSTAVDDKPVYDDKLYTRLSIRDHNGNNQKQPVHTTKPLDDDAKTGNPPEVPPLRVDDNTQEPPPDTKDLELLDDDDITPDVPSSREDTDGHHESFA